MLKPLASEALIGAVESSDLVVTVEEHSLVGGLRDAVAPLLAARPNAPCLLGLGVEDGATRGIIKGQPAMRVHCGLDGESVAERVRAALRA